jgi:polysaccharide chain length determinant protein (PEP-CTERM system associated)
VLPGRKYTPEDIGAIAWRRKWLIVIAVCVVTTSAIALALQLPDIYRSQTLILVIPQRVPESYVRSTVTTRIEDRLRSLRQQILSRTRLERVIQDFNLYQEELQEMPMEQIIEDMRANVGVDTVRDDAFTVSFTSTSPRTAMIVADRLATMFIEESMRDREGLADDTNQFLESQLNEARTRLVTHEQRLEAYRRQYSGELPTQLQSNLQVIQSTQAQIQTLTESINRDRDRRLGLERSMNETIDAPGTGADLPGGVGAFPKTEAAKAIEDLERARNELLTLQQRLTPEHPDVTAKIRAVKLLETKVREMSGGGSGSTEAPSRPMTTPELIRTSRAKQYQTEIDKLDTQIAQKETEMQRLRQMMTDYQRKVEAVPGHESELTSLMRDYETLQRVYTDLLSKKENSQISANLERQQVGEQFKMLDPARVPEEPFSPNRPSIAGVAAAGGLAFAIALIAFLEYRDSTLRTEDEIVRTLVLPVIAAIPIMAAVADVRRQRRISALVGAATVVAVAGLSVAIWQMVR